MLMNATPTKMPSLIFPRLYMLFICLKTPLQQVCKLHKIPMYGPMIASLSLSPTLYPNQIHGQPLNPFYPLILISLCYTQETDA